MKSTWRSFWKVPQSCAKYSMYHYNEAPLGTRLIPDSSPIPGVPERIATLRARYEQLSSSISYQESRVAKQAAELDRIYRPKEFADDEDGVDEDQEVDRESRLSVHALAKESQMDAVDMRQEEEDIKELERKKRGLEDRVSGMERDLGGLLR